jgi:DNA-binding Lrp family transcriptional regulator
MPDRSERDELDATDQRILALMRRAPAGQYTAAQIARNASLRLPEVEPRLARFEQAGIIKRSQLTVTPAFHVVQEGPIQRAAPPTARELAERPPAGADEDQ